VNLSRRGWNNVMIFVILAMMLIFQYSGNKLNGNTKNAAYQTALPANGVILSMQMDNMTIRRIGAELEVQPPLNLSQTQLGKIVKTWETATFKTVPSDIQISNLNYGIKINFQLANISEPVVVILYQIDSGYLLQNWQQQLLQIDESELQLLLPR